MTNVKRFGLRLYTNGLTGALLGAVMVEQADGKYGLHADYSLLLARLERMQKALTGAIENALQQFAAAQDEHQRSYWQGAYNQQEGVAEPELKPSPSHYHRHPDETYTLCDCREVAEALEEKP